MAFVATTPPPIEAGAGGAGEGGPNERGARGAADSDLVLGGVERPALSGGRTGEGAVGLGGVLGRDRDAGVVRVVRDPPAGPADGRALREAGARQPGDGGHRVAADRDRGGV